MSGSIHSSLASAFCLSVFILIQPLVLADDGHDHGPPVISAGHTTLWYDPARNGEGWSLEILGGQTALLYWFTYDEKGEQRWLVADGVIIDGHSIDFPELLSASGGRFGPDFDPDEVELEVVGSGLFHFDDCDHGWAEFDAYGQQFAVDLRRISRSMLIDCNPPANAIEDERGLQTGSWFDPSFDGQGYSLQWMTSGLALVTWFSFDPEGNPFWMQGVGQSVDDELHFDFVYSTAGPRFGEAFDAADLEILPWGTLDMQLACLDGAASYESELANFGAGSFELTRLSVPAGLECPQTEEPSPPGLAGAIWQSTLTGAPMLSEMPAAALGDHIYIAGGMTSLQNSVRDVWRFHPPTSQWSRMADLPERRDHAMMAAHGGRLYFFGGYRSVLSGATSTAWTYDPTSNSWSQLPDMPGVRVAGQAVSLGEHIYVAGGLTTHPETIYRYTPSSNSWQTIPISDFWQRDHSQAVAYQGEIWILGGRGSLVGGHGGVTIYNPETGASRQGPPMRFPRSGFAVGVYRDHIVVAGGERFFPTMVVRSAEAYSAETGWQFIDDLPVAVHGPGSATWQNGFYVIAGSVVVGDILGVDQVQKLSVP